MSDGVITDRRDYEARGVAKRRHSASKPRHSRDSFVNLSGRSEGGSISRGIQGQPKVRINSTVFRGAFGWETTRVAARNRNSPEWLANSNAERMRGIACDRTPERRMHMLKRRKREMSRGHGGTWAACMDPGPLTHFISLETLRINGIATPIFTPPIRLSDNRINASLR
jgi:hypothetical protein